MNRFLEISLQFCVLELSEKSVFTLHANGLGIKVHAKQISDRNTEFPEITLVYLVKRVSDLSSGREEKRSFFSSVDRLMH